MPGMDFDHLRQCMPTAYRKLVVRLGPDNLTVLTQPGSLQRGLDDLGPSSMAMTSLTQACAARAARGEGDHR